jgi:DnaD/phage-associated family protein
MDYLKECKAFYESLEYNQLSSGQIALWLVLFNICNKSGWEKWFTVANSRLASSGLSASGIAKARNRLKQLGYIDFKPQGRNKATAYRIISRLHATGLQDSTKQSNSQSSKQSTKQSNSQSSKQGVEQSNKQSTALYKQNKTKQNSSGSNTHTCEDVFNFWQQKLNWGFPNGIVMADLTGWITEFGPDLVIFALTIAGKKQVTAGAADSFLSSVFNSWRQQHISTLEQAQKANESHEKNTYNQRQQRNYYRKRAPINEGLPEWFKKQQKQEEQPNKQHYERIDDSGDPMPHD